LDGFASLAMTERGGLAVTSIPVRFRQAGADSDRLGERSGDRTKGEGTLCKMVIDKSPKDAIAAGDRKPTPCAWTRRDEGLILQNKIC
jgi:hypothetical protein